ncbi:MAG: immunoglobulin domain-containing protein [Opitutus sp.]
MSSVAASAATLTITWDDNSSTETGFKVERSVDGGSFVQIGTVAANVVTYKDTTAIASNAYAYRVATFDATMTSAYSNVATVTVPPAAVAPTITTQPAASQSVTAGADITFAGVAAGSPAPTLQWRKNGVQIAAATSATLSITAVTSLDAASYTVVATNSAGTVTSSAAVLAVNVVAPPTTILTPPMPTTQTVKQLTQAPPTPGVSSPATPLFVPLPLEPDGIQPVVPVIAGRLMNLSVRAIPGPDDRALLIGFVVKNSPKSMLIRAVGPGLSTYSNAATFKDPALTLYQGATMVGANDDWNGSETLKATAARLGAFPLPESSKDAGVLATFGAKAYTANITGAGTGLALAELYDADTDAVPAGRLVNFSARAHAGSGDSVLIVGFVISGDTPLRVLIRAIGPTLANYGVTTQLADPQLKLYRGNTLVDQNDDWGGRSDLTAAFMQTGAFVLQNPASKDAAMIVTLGPGAYTVIVSGAGDTNGIALAEVYELP